MVLRLARSASSAGTVTVSAVAGCTPGAPVVSARLARGGELALELTAQEGTGAGYYVARVRVGRAVRSVELVVPARPVLRLLG